MLKPLPYRDPAGLIRIYETFVSSAGAGTGTVSGANLRDWREQNRSFETLGAYAFQSANLQDVSEPERLSVVTITSGLLLSLGAKPLMGRTLGASDDRADAPEVAVLSSGLWRRRFGADPNTIGKNITLDGLPVTIVGVMPPAFEFPPGAFLVELWRPFRLTPGQWANRGTHQYSALGRLKPGVTIEMATSDLKQIAARLAELYPSNQRGRSVLLRPLHEDVSGNVRPALLTLMGAVGFVLLIACANVANLMLARAAGRAREVAVRIALGASRGRLIRQLVVESVLLSLTGGAAGVLLAFNGLPLLVKMGANQIPRAAQVGIDPLGLVRK